MNFARSSASAGQRERTPVLPSEINVGAGAAVQAGLDSAREELQRNEEQAITAITAEIDAAIRASDPEVRRAASVALDKNIRAERLLLEEDELARDALFSSALCDDRVKETEAKLVAEVGAAIARRSDAGCQSNRLPLNNAGRRRAASRFEGRRQDLPGSTILPGAAPTGAGTKMGSPKPHNPKQIHGAGGVGRRVNVWWIGAILYEALAGQQAHARFRPNT